MGKHSAGGWRFRSRQTAIPRQTDAPSTLTAAHCGALADQLATVYATVGQSVEALHALADAGGELHAPLTLRGQAFEALRAMVETMQHAQQLMARAVSER